MLKEQNISNFLIEIQGETAPKFGVEISCITFTVKGDYNLSIKQELYFNARIIQELYLSIILRIMQLITVHSESVR